MQRYIAVSLLALTLLTVPAFGAQVSIGVRIGPPPPPRVVRVVPARPGPQFAWVEGYWYPVGHSNHWKWHPGYWTRAPYPEAIWYAPRYERGEYFEGYWEAHEHGKFKHNHGWDKHHERDYWEFREHDRR
jgi:hypothetical protein